MPNLVVSGATLRCTMGSAPSALVVAPDHPRAGGQPVATILDNKPVVNIPPFGLCSSPSNPGVLGRRLPPCAPAIPAAWTPGSSRVKAGNVSVLHQSCQCACQWGGVISIVAPGQQTTSAS